MPRNDLPEEPPFGLTRVLPLATWRGLKRLKYDDVDTLVIHHTASDKSTFKSVHKYHKKHNKWAGIGYHIFIDNSGVAYEGRPLEIQGAHVRGENHHTWGIALAGNNNFSWQQINSLFYILKMLRRYNRPYHSPRIVCGHRDLAPTKCPGEGFWGEYLQEILGGF